MMMPLATVCQRQDLKSACRIFVLIRCRLGSQLFELFFADVFEQFDDFLDLACRITRDLCCEFALSLSDAPHQVDDTTISVNLERTDIQIFGVDDRGFYLAGDQRIIGARTHAGHRGDDQIIFYRLHAIDRYNLLFDLGLHFFIFDFAGQQHHAVVAVGIDVGAIGQVVAHVIRAAEGTAFEDSVVRVTVCVRNEDARTTAQIGIRQRVAPTTVRGEPVVTTPVEVAPPQPTPSPRLTGVISAMPGESPLQMARRLAAAKSALANS